MQQNDTKRMKKKYIKKVYLFSCKFGHAPMFENASAMVRITKVLGVDKK
jgi:hypothetical protein